jgi:hypothetical protein
MRTFPILCRALPLLAAVALTACGGGGSNNAVSSSSSSSGTGSSSSSSSSGAANVVSVIVGPGPTKTSSFFNIPATTIKLCLPGSTTHCQTITHILVDTGSYGLRVMASALNGLIATADYQQDPSTGGNFVVECLPFADGFTWGPVASVDLYIGGEKALALPINIIDDSMDHDTLQPAPPANCQAMGNGNDISSADSLGANGVLGVGLFSYDCGIYCTLPVSSQTQGNLYYSCGATVCGATSEPLADQVINPVALFPVDNNGVILQMDAVGTSGATTANGKLIFGIGTQTNNALGGATVLTTDNSGAITTIYKGQTLSASFLDSGSNGLFFPDSSLPNCGNSAVEMQFYCPTTTQSSSATNEGQNGASAPAPFSIGNLNAVSGTIFAISDVGGPTTSIANIGTAYFDFGVPFFYGRSVFTGMETPTQGPYFAY